MVLLNVSWAIVACVIARYLYKHPILRIHGCSMYPTYKDGDVVLGLRYNYKHCDIRQGSVVVVNSPNGVKAIKRATAFKYKEGIMYVWVEGDNPSESYDSRNYGWLTTKDIVAIDPKPRVKEKV